VKLKRGKSDRTANRAEYIDGRFLRFDEHNHTGDAIHRKNSTGVFERPYTICVLRGLGLRVTNDWEMPVRGIRESRVSDQGEGDGNNDGLFALALASLAPAAVRTESKFNMHKKHVGIGLLRTTLGAGVVTGGLGYFGSLEV